MAELLSCPFCGGKAFVEEHKFHGCSNTYGVKCSKCHTQTFQFFDTEEIAVKRWNTRTPKERGAKNRYLYILGKDKREKRMLEKLCKYDLKGGANG